MIKINELSTCFCTTKVDECREFNLKKFASKVIFDYASYVTIKINQDGSEISFIQLQESIPVFGGEAVMLNFNVDSEYSRLSNSGLPIEISIENHPWEDRGFQS